MKPLVMLMLLAGAPAASRDAAADASRWLGQHKHQIMTTDPERIDRRDLGPLTTALGSARIAAFGEATHGAREFFRLKDRAFRALVQDAGYTTFAIEANYGDAEAIDAWIKGGPGDAEALVGRLGFWTWDTEEVLALVVWLRSWNFAHDNMLSFRGIDMQFPPSNLAIAYAFLATANVAGAPPRRVFADYEAQATDTSTGYAAIAAMPATQQLDMSAAAEQLFQTFEVNRQQLVAAGGEPAYLRARGAALAAAWYFVGEAPLADRRFRNFRTGFDIRDRAMADLAVAAAERGKGRTFVWAHNAHVTRARHVDTRQTMGQFLGDELGGDYVSVGFAFDRGSFQAKPPTSAPSARPLLQAMTVPPAPAGSAEAVLRLAGQLWFADLRTLDPGTPAYGWFKARHPLRWTGSDYSIELMAKHPPISLVDSFDLLVFIGQTTRARPLAATRTRNAIAKDWADGEDKR